MTKRPSRKISMLCSLLLFLDAPRALMAEPTPAAISAFDNYARAVEARLVQQHRSDVFLVPTAVDSETRLRRGDLIVEQLTPSVGGDLSGAMLHHWRGTAFVPGATAADFEHLMRDFNSYPQHFAPQVLQAKALTPPADHMQAWMRIRQHHVITVVMDTSYDVTFGQRDVQHGYSVSRSTRIAEMDGERALSGSEEHGFLWRLNTYWSYEQREGGLYVQIEAVSLTRSIPRGLAWAVRPYVESVPRESVGFTLRSACNAMRKPERTQR